MKMYCYMPQTARTDLQRDYELILKTLRRGTVWLSSNLSRQPIQLPPDDLAAAEASGEPLLEQMDALVIEGTDSDQQAGYLVALAMSLKTPTLFLYRRGSIPHLFRHLTSRLLPKWIQVSAYTNITLERIVERFVGGLSGRPLREVPRIKFTLRITRSIERYLSFKTHNTDTTKADWLREQIERLMSADKDWQTFSKKESDESEAPLDGRLPRRDN